MLRNPKIIIRVLIFIVVIETAAIVYLLYSSSTSKSFNGYVERKSKRFGKCISQFPSGVADSNYVKVEVIVKGANLTLREFEWNGLDYTSRPGCFTSNKDRTIKTMNNYILRRDSICTFSSNIRTTVADNECEFSIKVYDLKNKIIGKYPENSETLKSPVPSLGYPLLLQDNIILKK